MERQKSIQTELKKNYKQLCLHVVCLAAVTGTLFHIYTICTCTLFHIILCACLLFSHVIYFLNLKWKIKLETFSKILQLHPICFRWQMICCCLNGEETKHVFSTLSKLCVTFFKVSGRTGHCIFSSACWLILLLSFQ